MKVLILSHNAISPLSSIGKTLESLFCRFKKEELCQLYIHKSAPQGDICSSYFSFTDKDVLKGVFTRKVSGNQVSPVFSEQLNDISSLDFLTYGSSHKREPYMELLRELIWKISPWYNKALKSWIEEQKPTCIFVAIGSGTFLYDIAIKISRDFEIPIVTYICDDFYNMKKPKKLLGGLWKQNINKKTGELLSYSKAVVGICDGISEAYGKEFNIDSYTIMTGTNFSVKESAEVRENVEKISYFGKISLNRYLSLLDICKSLDEINEKSGTQYKASIFCDEPDDAVKKAFSSVKSAVFKGFVTDKEFEKEFFSSDVLLFVEAFDRENTDRVKNSVSTKIADSLASGIPLFAYAPDSIASIRHLINNKCAMFCSEKNELTAKLEQFFSDVELRTVISKNALSTAHIFHEPASVSQKLYKILEKF